jgi:hypothetical protein
VMGVCMLACFEVGVVVFLLDVRAGSKWKFEERYRVGLEMIRTPSLVGEWMRGGGRRESRAFPFLREVEG